MSLINVETKAGKPIQIGEATITPFANAMQVKLPFIQGGLVWNRPVAVAVQTAQGQEYILPIQDVTRQILFALMGASLIGGVLLLFFSRKSRKGKR
jgi:LPXTG-motif cell wall-anchored protein